MIQINKHSILLFFCIVFTMNVYSQENGKIKMLWVKEDQAIQNNGFFFNVLWIENTATEDETVTLFISLPDGSRLLTQVPTEIEIAGRQAKSIPIRFAPSKTSRVDSTYIIQATATQHGEAIQATTSFQIAGVHKLKMDFSESSITFQPGQNTAIFEILVQNEGDYEEQISLELELTETLAFYDRTQKQIGFILEPGANQKQEIEIRYKSGSDDQTGSEGWINVDMVSGQGRQSKRIPVSKLENVFDSFGNKPLRTENRVEYYLSHHEGIGFSSHITAEGTVGTGKGNIEYGVQLRDIKGSNYYNFLEENFFELSYHTNSVAYGLGTSSFQGLSGLFKRNSLFVDKAFNINEHNRIRLFANESVNQFNLGLAAGHEYISQKFSTTNSLGWNTNGQYGTQSLLFENSSSVYLGPFSMLYRGNYTNVTGENTVYDESTYSHTLKMQGKVLDEKLDIELNHRLLNSDRTNYLQNASYLYSNLRYLFNDRGLMAIVRYNNTSVLQDIGIRTSKSNSNQLRSQLIVPLKSGMKFTSGFQLGSFKNDVANYKLFSEKNASLFSDLRYSFSKFSGRSSVQYGLKALDSSYEKYSFWNAGTELEYDPTKKTNFFMELSYRDGAAQVYQAERQKEVEAQLGVKQALPGKKNYLTLAAYYNDSPYTVQSPMSMKAGVNLWMPGNINLNVNVGVKSSYYTGKMGVSAVEARLVKHFNWKDEEKEYYDIELVFFKDDNGNNVVEKEEGRIQGIKVMLIPLNTKTKASGAASLVSAESGVVRYKNLVAGKYLVKYYPIDDLKGYFNFGKSEMTIDLVADQTIETGFSKAGKIYGAIILNRSQFSSLGNVDLANIRITAINSLGKSYSTLTDRFGNYTIYIPENQKYTVSINNLFGDKFEIKQDNSIIDLSEKDSHGYNFEISEKKRKINFSK